MSASNSPVFGIRSASLGRTKKKIAAPFSTLTRPRAPRVKFGVPIADALRDDKLPAPLVDMMVYIAQEGVTTSDLFRRNGNPTDLRMIIKRLSEGKDVDYSNYNFYTLASVLKKFLLKIPGGAFGPEKEQQLLDVLELDTRIRQYDIIHDILETLPEATQQLLALLFGTWFRLVNHYEYNSMSSEAVAKSVAPSLFHTCADSPEMVEKAVNVLQILIDDFGVANMFGRKNIQYFADVTRTGINVREKYRYEFRYPADASVPLEQYLQVFSRLLHSEAKTRGFDPQKDAITEEEFYGSPVARSRDRSDTKGSGGSSNVEIRLPPSGSSPPSPQSLQQSSHDFNPHKKLTQVSSLSAPEVNQGCCSSPSGPDRSGLSTSKHLYLSTSLSRFDHVRRKQMLRLKKRSNWFLSPSQLADSESALPMGSHEASISSDVTVSDGCLSSSEIDCSCDDSVQSTPGLTPIRSHQPLQRVALMQQRQYAQGSDLTSTPKRPPTQQQQQQQESSSNNGLLLAEEQPANNLQSSLMPSKHPGSPVAPGDSVSESDVRFFMVESFYGSPSPLPQQHNGANS